MIVLKCVRCGNTNLDLQQDEDDNEFAYCSKCGILDLDMECDLVNDNKKDIRIELLNEIITVKDKQLKERDELIEKKDKEIERLRTIISQINFLSRI